MNNKLTVHYLKTRCHKLSHCKSTTIIYCYKYTMMCKRSHVNKDSSLRNAQQCLQIIRYVCGFLKLLWFMHQCMCVSVCVPPKGINNQWRDMAMCDWFKKFYGFSLLLIALYDTCHQKMDRHGQINTARCERLPKRTKVMRYQLQKDYQKD